MPTARSDGVEIAYELAGPADGEPVALLQGLGYGRWMWRWQRERLADEFVLVCPDTRGTGESDAPEGPYEMEQFAADLEAVLADAGLDRVHLVGASMGGAVALQYALTYDRAATLSVLCTSPGGDDAVPIPESTRERIFDVPEGADERDLLRHRMRPAVSEGFYDDHPGLVDRILDWRLEQDASEAARTAQAAAVEGVALADRLDEISLPTLVVHGDADRVVPVENGRLLAGRLPNARLELVEGGSHLCFVEDADAVADAVRAFLRANPIDAPAAE